MMITFYDNFGLKKVKGKLTSNVLFFLFHLSLQVRQQRFSLPAYGEDDCTHVVARGLQSESVQGQAANHSLAARESAEKGRK